MQIAIASDHAGYELKEQLKSAFGDIDWLDLGTDGEASVDYPDFGFAMGEAITGRRAAQASSSADPASAFPLPPTGIRRCGRPCARTPPWRA